ncbi:MAG: ribonucleoside triphosphate reductase [Elusimicrobiaceae bacterium]
MIAAVRTFDKIKKRNGKTEAFDANRIIEAIQKAGEATGEFKEDTAKQIAVQVISTALQMYGGKMPNVEDIQDIVENALLSSSYRKTAKAYIIYREQHAQIREISAKFNVGLVDQYLKKLDWLVNENSNMDFSLQGLNNYVASEISKIYWLDKVYPQEIKGHHVEGDFHIHDLGLLGAYCVGWDLQDLLSNGFRGARGKSESKPARHFRTALGHIVNFFYTLQGESAGAQAFSNFDTLLAPFIRYDELSYKEVKQALQEFIFNVNVPTRVGFQTPFTNVTLDLNVPSYFKKQGVIIGGKVQDAVYGDFQKEMDMFNRAFLEVMLEGDAKGRVFTFPIPTYNITRDFDWDNPQLDLLWQITAKYGIPYFANFINSEMDPEDARSMCCRLRIDNRELNRRGGGLFGSAPLTGSIGVVTINMPRLGYLAGNEDDFRARLVTLMDAAKNSLEIKRKALEKMTDANLYPYMKYYLRNIKERFGKYWRNHFATIGLTGMNEACQNLLGKDIGTTEGREFTLRTLDFMRAKLTEYQQETGNNYNLEATPAEGTSYRLAKIDLEKYPDIIFANGQHLVDHKPFYTNSTQLPVNYTDDVFEILDLQDEAQCRYTGGTVQHLFVGERIKDPSAVKAFLKKVCETYKLPYVSITPTFSVCPKCGYLDGEQHLCPKCGHETEVYSRVVGYLRPVTQWNEGKKEEFFLRKTGSIVPSECKKHVPA